MIINLENSWEQLFELACIKCQRSSFSLADLIAITERFSQAQREQNAVALYREWIAHHQDSPLLFAAYFNLGAVCKLIEGSEQAEQAYRNAIDHKYDFIQAHFNLGTELEQQGRFQDALNQWQLILHFDQNLLADNQALHLLTLNNLGRLLEVLKQYQDAEHMLECSLRIDPHQEDVIHHWIHLRQYQCEWPLFKVLPGLLVENILHAASALTMLSITDDLHTQKNTALRYVTSKVMPPVLNNKAVNYQHDKLRIAYISSDFCTHPVSMLTVELFELHNREHFEVYGFCYTPLHHYTVGDMRERVIKAMDHFIVVLSMTDQQAAECIRACEIDILIDLQGLTAGVRPNILSYRPAPVQITYLGFPGPTALPSIDYVLADTFLIPPKWAHYYPEKPLYLPHVYQVSDRQRKANAIPSRRSCQLPEDAFVFCSFSNNYKFTEDMFACWMRILSQVPNSVLWLLADNTWANDNMYQTARQHGISEARLILAPRVSIEDYLARYAVADLFLDTFPFNGGTTANDVLWMGLPLLTLTGQSFASRMAGSLLHSLGLDELITYTLADYEQQAVALATHREKLTALRKQLSLAKETSDLFNMPQLVSDIETLYRSITSGIN